MDISRGQILAVHPGYAIVSVAPGQACPRCAAGKGCGAGLLYSAELQREIRVPLAAGSPLRAGDRVELGIPSSELLRAAIYAYGTPLAGMLLALAIAGLLPGPLTDSLAVLAATAGLATAWAGCRAWLSRPQCSMRLQPGIVTHDNGAG